MGAVAIVGGGVAGLTAAYRLKQHGVRVVIDKMSVPYLSQATVDFIDSLEKSGFTIDNPAAQGGCACGHSFH